MVLIPASSLQLIWLPVALGLYNYLTRTCLLWASHLHSIQPVDSRGYPWYLRPDAPVIYTGAFLLLKAWPGSVCYNISTYFLHFEIREHPPSLVSNSLFCCIKSCRIHPHFHHSFSVSSFGRIAVKITVASAWRYHDIFWNWLFSKRKSCAVVTLFHDK